MEVSPVIEPTIMGSAVYTNDCFGVYVGLGKDRDVLPHYLCINLSTNVVEFEAESFFMARSWADHFEKETKSLDKIPDITVPASAEVVQFKKPEKLN